MFISLILLNLVKELLDLYVLRLTDRDIGLIFPDYALDDLDAEVHLF